MNKNKLVNLTIFFSLLTVKAIIAQTSNDFAANYYILFNAPNDGTGREIMFANFSKVVPSASQAEVLAEILDRAASAHPPSEQAISDVIIFLRGVGHDLEWNDHLERSLYAQAKSTDKNQRILIVSLLAQKDPTKSREVVLSLQNDSDEEVRYSAIHAITKWPDAESIYQKFIQDHKSDPSYARSVHAAQNHIHLVHEFHQNK